MKMMIPTSLKMFWKHYAMLAPKGSFLHDKIDGNGDAHVKSAIMGPSEAIPFENGRMLLGTWQSVMLCEFDGPKYERKVIVTLFTG